MSTITINKEQFDKLYALACSTWKDTLRDKCNFLLVQEIIEVEMDDVNEALEAADREQAASIKEILALNRFSNLLMEVGKWYEEEDEGCFFQYLGNN